MIENDDHVVNKKPQYKLKRVAENLYRMEPFGTYYVMARRNKELFRQGRIRFARLQAKPAVSQEDLAGRLAVMRISLDRSASSRIENQDRYLMDYEIAAIAKCLKVTVAWLFSE
jgi:hypothetical protein